MFQAKEQLINKLNMTSAARMIYVFCVREIVRSKMDWKK